MLNKDEEDGCSLGLTEDEVPIRTPNKKEWSMAIEARAWAE